MRMRELAVVLGAIAILAWVSAPRRRPAPVVTASPVARPAPPIGRGHFDYHDLVAIRQLVKDDNALLVNSLQPDGYAMWRDGKLKMPDEPAAGTGALADINADGQLDRTLVLRGQGQVRLVVVTPASRPTTLLGVQSNAVEQQALDPSYLLANGRAAYKAALVDSLR